MEINRNNPCSDQDCTELANKNPGKLVWLYKLNDKTA